MTENEATERCHLCKMKCPQESLAKSCAEGRAFATKEVVRLEKELEQYRKIGTVEELLNAVKEEDVLKFYYCESEGSYLVGIRIDNFYYAHWDGKRFIFDMSRYLPWGEHVVNENTAWKEYTYPSEPKEIDFSSWLQGFIRKECGGTIEECREAVKIHKELNERKLTSENIEEYMKFEDECIKKGFTFKSLLEAREKQTAKRPDYEGDGYADGHLVYDTWICPCCGKRYEVDYDNYNYCPYCGQKLDWSDEE